MCEDARVEGMTQFNLAHAYRLKPDLRQGAGMRGRRGPSLRPDRVEGNCRPRTRWPTR